MNANEMCRDDGAEMENATCGLNYLSHTRPNIALLSQLGLCPDLCTVQEGFIWEMKESIEICCRSMEFGSYKCQISDCQAFQKVIGQEALMI